jgi:hypothetical protein
MEHESAVSNTPAAQAATPTPTIAENYGEPNERSCMHYIVQTDFTATYQWEGEAESEEQAGEKAYGAVANMDASDLWSEMYGYGQKVELIEPEVANILKQGCYLCGVAYRCTGCGSVFCECPASDGVIGCHPAGRPQMQQVAEK